MATKRRTDYRVDEDALKRMMAGDVTALEETAAPAETPGNKALPFPGETGEENLCRFPKTANKKISG